jgi:hypothetical protein
VRERSAGNAFAQVTAATRVLVESGCRIVIDASPNSLEPESDATRRQLSLDVEEMPRQVMMRAPQFSAMFEHLQGLGLDEVVWQIMGGVASSLVDLAARMDEFAENACVKHVVAKSVKLLLDSAIVLAQKCAPRVKEEVLPLFVERPRHCWRAGGARNSACRA